MLRLFVVFRPDFPKHSPEASSSQLRAGGLEVAQIRGRLWSLRTPLQVVRKTLVSSHFKVSCNGRPDVARSSVGADWLAG